MGDEGVQEQIRSQFLRLFNETGDQNFRLVFQIAGREYSAKLHVSVSVQPTYFIFDINIGSCLKSTVSFPKNGSPGYFDSSIELNTPQKACFAPTLVGNRENPNISLRYTNTDVLQILKTKLTYLMPLPKNFQMRIADHAVSNYVCITDFNILRGKDPFYKKYGYVYQRIGELQEFVRGVKWKDIMEKDYPKVREPFYIVFKRITGIDYDPNDSIETVMKTISFEKESSFNLALIKEYERHILKVSIKTSDIYISTAVLNVISRLEGYPKGLPSILQEPYHDPTSPEWIAASARIQLMNFEDIVNNPKDAPPLPPGFGFVGRNAPDEKVPVAIGVKGGKQKRKTPRYRKQKKRTRRLKKGLKA